MIDSPDYCTCNNNKNIHTEFNDQGSLSICDNCHKLVKDSFKSFESYPVKNYVKAKEDKQNQAKLTMADFYELQTQLLPLIKLQKLESVKQTVDHFSSQIKE